MVLAIRAAYGSQVGVFQHDMRSRKAFTCNFVNDCPVEGLLCVQAMLQNSCKHEHQKYAFFHLLFNFPSPALPGSGAMGMISARNIGAPPLESDAKLRNFYYLLSPSTIYFCNLQSAICNLQSSSPSTITSAICNLQPAIYIKTFFYTSSFEVLEVHKWLS